MIIRNIYNVLGIFTISMSLKNAYKIIALLFINIFLFILFDRLSYGLPARIWLSFVLAFLLTATMVASILWSTKYAGNELNKSEERSYKTTFFILSTLLSFIISIIYTYVISKDGGPEGGLAFLVVVPFLTLVFIIFSRASLSVMKYLLFDISRLQKAVHIFVITSILLLILDIFFLANCTTDGCKNPIALAKKALFEKNPTICKERQLRLDFRSKMPSLFMTNSDPTGGFGSPRIQCFDYYADERPDDLPIQIKRCIEIGFIDSDCIDHSFEVSPYPTQCEELITLDMDNVLGYNPDRMNSYSLCYRKLAFLQNESKYCEKVNPLYFGNLCYADMASRNNDETICNNIIPDGDINGSTTRQKYVNAFPYSKSKEECAKRVNNKKSRINSL